MSWKPPTSGPYAVKVHYLDASAIVKLFADDGDELPGREALRQYYFDHASMFTHQFCLAEALSAFKRKLSRKIFTEDKYLHCLSEFFRLGIGLKLQVDDIGMLSPILRSETERLIKGYGIDFIDAVQILILLRGTYPHFCGDSQSILITADRKLAEAARCEHARVWECTTEPPPI